MLQGGDMDLFHDPYSPPWFLFLLCLLLLFLSLKYVVLHVYILYYVFNFVYFAIYVKNMNEP